MTQRNEPTVSTSAFDISGFFGKKQVEVVKTPEQLLADALKGFTDAQEQLEVAQEAIAAQKAEHEAEIKARQSLLATAEESHSRLERIKGRFADLLS